MTYYCPTHGDLGLVEPIEISKKDIRETFLKKGSNSKKQLLGKKAKLLGKSLILWGINKLLI